MLSRFALLALVVAALLVGGPASGGPSGSSPVTVTVVGVPSGQVLMGRWLGKQLFVRTVALPSDGGPFSFSIDVPAGEGRLQLWVLTMGQPGVNTAATVKAALRSGRRYTLAVTTDATSALRATFTEDPASDIAQGHRAAVSRGPA